MARRRARVVRTRFADRESAVENISEFADVWQTESLMHAGINASLRGEDADALLLFRTAQKRFTRLKKPLDAGIARAWIKALEHDHAEGRSDDERAVTPPRALTP